MLREHQLHVKLSKCTFGKSKVEYLGHIILEAGVATDPNKIAAMVSWPIPQFVKELKEFFWD